MATGVELGQSALRGISARQPRAAFTPVVVSDESDALIAHPHGLNLARA